MPLSIGDDFARRYAPDINLFACARDESAAALESLSGLASSSSPLYILQVPEIRIPSGLRPSLTALGVQMVASGPMDPERDSDDIVPLGDADAEQMLALATRTRPGPFLRHTHRMGRFVGIRIDGRLAAMAGERFRFPGYTEISGVCTHPDFRGRGLARRLSRHVGAHITARGDTAFLHAWKNNVAAISLYESLGFTIRSDVHVAVLEPMV